MKLGASMTEARAGLKARLRAREPLLCAVVSVPSPELVEVSAHAGFDFAILDAEHGAFTLTEIAHAIRAAQSLQLPILVRGPEPSKDFVLRCLDAGADGFVAPEIESAAQAEALVQATHYPPYGHRGAAFYSRAYGYTRSAGAVALKAADDAIVTGAHIETPDGVANAEAIMSVPGIDLILLGLSDLRVRLSGTEDIAAEVNRATSLIGKIAREKGIAASVGAQTPDDAKRMGALGFCVTVTSVMPLLLRFGEQYANGCRAALEDAAKNGKSI